MKAIFALVTLLLMGIALCSHFDDEELNRSQIIGE